MKRNYLILILCVSIAVVTAGGCGYRLSGLGKDVPAHIKTIAIPDFENKTIRIEAEQFVTFSVKEEFIRRSNLRMVNTRGDADSVLEGEIVTFDVTPVSMTEDASANLYRINIVLNVRFIDLGNNEIIFEGDNISFTETYDIDEEDFFSQETETLREIAERFAESVVTTILENF